MLKKIYLIPLLIALFCQGCTQSSVDSEILNAANKKNSWMDSELLNIYDAHKSEGLENISYLTSHFCNLGIVIIKFGSLKNSTSIVMFNKDTKQPVTCDEYYGYIKQFSEN